MSQRRKRINKHLLEDSDGPRSKSRRSSQASQRNSSTPKTKRGGKNASQAGSSQDARQSSQKQTSMLDFAKGGKKAPVGLLSAADALELAGSTAFFCLAGSTTKAPVVRLDIMKTVMANHNPKHYPQIIEKTSEIMQDIFGLRLISSDERPLAKTDKILVVNSLGSSKNVPETTDDDENAHRTLLCLLLNCIFVAGGRITEATLLDFIQELQLGAQDTNNPAFGNIPQRINSYKTQMYLKYEKDKTVDPPAMMVEWGPRANAEICKKNIRLWVRQLYPELQLSDLSEMTLSQEEEEDEEEEDEEEEDEEKTDDEDNDESSEDESADK